RLAYEVPKAAHIVLAVYNLLGQEVIRLVDAEQQPGRYELVWTGRTAQGLSVASGVYLYRLTSSTGFSETKRMTLLK
ncbi:MAG: T9SS type A sorting domain-containing protein, partial [Candidatus Latescibacteria bacterium]|nr:T9SS type A sorting domain-containing protein [Candidatus Latescibacterota bacterium]